MTKEESLKPYVTLREIVIERINNSFKHLNIISYEQSTEFIKGKIEVINQYLKVLEKLEGFIKEIKNDESIT